MSNNDEFEDAIEQLFYEQLIWKFEPEFKAAAERLGVSNDDLERSATEMESQGGCGPAFAYFCRSVISHRRSSALCALIRPGELEARGSISLTELVEREARTKADA